MLRSLCFILKLILRVPSHQQSPLYQNILGKKNTHVLISYSISINVLYTVCSQLLMSKEVELEGYQCVQELTHFTHNARTFKNETNSLTLVYLS